MEKSPLEIQIRILTNLSLRELLNVSQVSKYFLTLVRNHPWDLIIPLINEKKNVVQHILSSYRFRGYNFSYRRDLDKILDGLHSILTVEILIMRNCLTIGSNLYLFSGLLILDLHNASYLSDDSIVRMCRNRTVECPFDKIDLGFMYTSISDVSLEAISKIGCRELILDGNYCITDSGLIKIIASRKTSSLELCSCDKITDSAFVSISNGLVGIETIDLGKCNITDITLMKLDGCKKIHLRCCQKITDVGLSALRSCVSLSLYDNPHITHRGLMTLLDYGNLRELHVLQINCDTTELIRMYPHVAINKY